MTPNDSIILNLSVSKNLIDQDVAKDIYQECQNANKSAIEILLERGILTPHIAENLTKEAERAQAPKTIGGFRIVSKIGQGGMGAVYKAIQLSMQREVALKVIAPEVARDKDTCERFIREARSAGRINHPNVITCYDAGQDGNVLYMAMELVLGGDADQFAKANGGRLSERKALEIVLASARGLQAIHQAGLLHRDIKPANIFLTQTGEAKLADLGLARSQKGDDKMTMTGSALGTPAFMSPEQADGADDIDIRSDIYALGATLYALTVGKPPFRGASPWAVVAAVLKDPFPDPRAENPALSAALSTAVLKACARDRAERFQDPLAFAAELEALLKATPESGSVAMAPLEIDFGTPREASLATQRHSSQAGLRRSPPKGPASPPGIPRRLRPQSQAGLTQPSSKRSFILPTAIGGGLLLAILICWFALGRNDKPAAPIADPTGVMAATTQEASSPAKAVSQGENTTAPSVTRSTPQGAMSPAASAEAKIDPKGGTVDTKHPPVRIRLVQAIQPGPSTMVGMFAIEMLPLTPGASMFGGDVFPVWTAVPNDLAGMMVTRSLTPYRPLSLIAEGEPGSRIVVFISSASYDSVQAYIARGWHELPRFMAFIPLSFTFSSEVKKVVMENCSIVAAEGLARGADALIDEIPQSERQPRQQGYGRPVPFFRSPDELRVAATTSKWPRQCIAEFQKILGDGLAPRGTVADTTKGDKATIIGDASKVFASPQNKTPLPVWVNDEGWLRFQGEIFPMMFTGTPLPIEPSDKLWRGTIIIDKPGWVTVSVGPGFPEMYTPTPPRQEDLDAVLKTSEEFLAASGWRQQDGHDLRFWNRYCFAGEILVVPIPQLYQSYIKANPVMGNPQERPRYITTCSARAPWGNPMSSSAPTNFNIRYRGGRWTLGAQGKWFDPDAADCPENCRASIWAFKDNRWTKIVVLRAGTGENPQRVAIPEGFVTPSIRINAETITDAAFGKVWYESDGGAYKTPDLPSIPPPIKPATVATTPPAWRPATPPITPVPVPVTPAPVTPAPVVTAPPPTSQAQGMLMLYAKDKASLWINGKQVGVAAAGDGSLSLPMILRAGDLLVISCTYASGSGAVALGWRGPDHQAFTTRSDRWVQLRGSESDIPSLSPDMVAMVQAHPRKSGALLAETKELRDILGGTPSEALDGGGKLSFLIAICLTANDFVKIKEKP